jgi:hypothetical protein
MKTLRNIFGLGLVALTFVACSDAADEITSLIYGRNFAPIGVEAKVRNRTNVELSWNAAEGVTKYNVEVYENDSLTFAGSPIMTFSITPDQVPYTVTGLEGETPYSFRVQATSEDSSRDSKWSTAFAMTDAEQIFKNVAEEDIKGTSVVLRWPAGEEAATITLNPGNIVYNITAEDIATGAATITGLTAETEYTAVMSRANGKTRGKISFKTGIDLADTDILVKAGSDIVAAINDAPEGYRLVIEPGTYALGANGASAKLAISKSINMKGLRANDRPIINGAFDLKEGAVLTIEQCVIDGTGTDTTADNTQAFDFTEAKEYAGLTLTNCEIKNFVKGFYYVNKAATINAITINDCIIHDITCEGGDFMDARTGTVMNLSLTNTTLYNCATACRNIVRDNKKDPTTVIIDHCTFVNCMSADNSDGKSYPFFNMQCKTGSVKFTNNLLFNSVTAATSSANHKNTPTPTFDNNVYSEGCKFTTWDTSGYVADPQFKDAANADFTITNDNVKDKKAGDPRWIK